MQHSLKSPNSCFLVQNIFPINLLTLTTQTTLTSRLDNSILVRAYEYEAART
jgi:hypothetical protein